MGASIQRNWLTWLTAATLLVIFAFDSYSVQWRDLRLGGGLVALPLTGEWGVLPSAVRDGQWWRLISAGFVHADVLHIGFNLIGLLYAGTFVEDRYGRARWLAIYGAALLAGNLLAFVTSSDRTVTVGASGAIMGLFGAFAAFGARYWSQRDELSRGLGPILATLLNGLTHANVSNAAHVGGVVIGFLAAYTLGSRPSLARALSEAQEQLVAKSAFEETRFRDVPQSVIDDPSNKLVLRRGRGAQLAFAALALVCLLGGVYMIGTALWVTALLVAIGLGAVAATQQHLVLTPLGVRFASVISRRSIEWRDVQRFYPVQIGGRTVVGFVHRPSYLARVEARGGLGRVFRGGTQTLGADFGMSVDAEVELLEIWRRRWTGDAD